MYAVSSTESKPCIGTLKRTSCPIAKSSQAWLFVSRVRMFGEQGAIRMLPDFAYAIWGVPIEVVTNFPIENGNKS
jgi:hypothetical protein